jgi:lipopolysaccharide heptosyltransferase II
VIALASSRQLDWSTIRRLLLVRLRSIGDTVLMTATLTALKSWHPDTHIAVVSEPLAAPMLEDHPMVDELVISKCDLASRARLIRLLRQKRFDAAFDMHGGTTATIITALSGAMHTVGYKGYRCSWMLRWRAPSPDLILGRAKLHSVEQQLALLHWTGMPWPQSGPELKLTVSPDTSANLEKRLEELGLSNFAVIHPAATLKSKMWPTRLFASVIDHLSKKWMLPSIVIAGPSEQQIAQSTVAASSAHTRLLIGMNLKEVIALLGRARIFVGNDSGPMHIAAAMKCPIVAIFGSSNPTVWHPWTNSPYRVVQSTGHRQPWPSISDVTAAVDEVLKSALAAQSMPAVTGIKVMT